MNKRTKTIRIFLGKGIFGVAILFLCISFFMIFSYSNHRYELGDILLGEIWWNDEYSKEKYVKIPKNDFYLFAESILPLVQEAERCTSNHIKIKKIDVWSVFGFSEKQLEMLCPTQTLRFIGTKGDLEIEFFEINENVICGVKYSCLKKHNWLFKMLCYSRYFYWTDVNKRLKKLTEDYVAYAKKHGLCQKTFRGSGLQLHDVMVHSRKIFTQPLYDRTLGGFQGFCIPAVFAKLLVGESYL